MSFFSQNAMDFIKKYQPVIDVEAEVQIDEKIEHDILPISDEVDCTSNPPV